MQNSINTPGVSQKEIFEGKEILSELNNRWGNLTEDQSDQIQQMVVDTELLSNNYKHVISHQQLVIKILSAAVICLAISTAFFSMKFFASKN